MNIFAKRNSRATSSITFFCVVVRMVCSITKVQRKPADHRVFLVDSSIFLTILDLTFETDPWHSILYSNAKQDRLLLVFHIQFWYNPKPYRYSNTIGLSSHQAPTTARRHKPAFFKPLRKEARSVMRASPFEER